jgi:hypothetical protein
MGGKKVTVGILVVGWLVLARYARGMFWRMPSISTDRQTPRQCEELEKSVRLGINHRNESFFYRPFTSIFLPDVTQNKHTHTHTHTSHETNDWGITPITPNHTMSDIIGSVIITSAMSLEPWDILLSNVSKRNIKVSLIFSLLLLLLLLLLSVCSRITYLRCLFCVCYYYCSSQKETIATRGSSHALGLIV